MTGQKKFYLETSRAISSILIFYGSQVHKMEKVPYQGETNYFNCMVDEQLVGENLLYKLFSGEYSAKYGINQLFSFELTKETFQKRGRKLGDRIILGNPIIVNTPENFNHVVVEFPPKFTEIFGTNEIVYLVDAKAKKIALCPPGSSDADKLARGVDPTMKNFVGRADLTISADQLERFDEILRILDKGTFVVYCYEQAIEKEIAIEFAQK